MISAYEYSPLINYRDKKRIQDVTMSFFPEKARRKQTNNTRDSQETPNKGKDARQEEEKLGKKEPTSKLVHSDIGRSEVW
jgi:hypothetical protein